MGRGAWHVHGIMDRGAYSPWYCQESGTTERLTEDASHAGLGPTLMTSFKLDQLGLQQMDLVGDTAAAKSLQSCPTLCDPIDGSPPGSPVPGILRARTLEWVAMAFSNA